MKWHLVNAVLRYERRNRPDDIAGTDFLDRTTIALHAASACRDDKRLTERMGVPSRSGARLKGHI
jgi:hypothetical protein